MRVNDIRIRELNGERELSASIDGFRLWYRFPGNCQLSTHADAFLAAALLPAMRAGEPLTIEGAPVSSALLAGVDRIQDIYVHWMPDCQRVQIHADCAVAQEPVQPGVASFFSGGVDGTYTLSCHLDEITHLVFIKGVDIQVDNDVLFAKALSSNQHFADKFGKTLLPVATNIRRFCHPRGIPWGNTYNGSGLASVALALGFAKTYVASSYSYGELHPYGSHPLLDPLWSNEASMIIHDGCEAGRSDKLRAVAQLPGALDILRVCWQDEGYNCGTCEKCLRTMVALRLLGLHAQGFPPLDNLHGLGQLRMVSPDDEAFFKDNHQLALKVGDREVADVLGRVLHRHQIKQALLDLDKAFTGGRGKRVYRMLAGRRH